MFSVFRVDAATIDAARRGDRRALSRLLSALQDVWYRFCLSLLHDPDRAADATQETGLRFLKQIASFRGDSQIQTWSLGIALNVVRETKRRKTTASDEDMVELAVERSSTGSVEKLEESDMLKQTLQTLPDRQREALVLRFFDRLSVRDIAAEIGRSEGATESLLGRARAAFERAYEEAPDAD